MAAGGGCFRKVAFSDLLSCLVALAKLLAQPAPAGFAGGAVLRCWSAAGGVSQK